MPRPTPHPLNAGRVLLLGGSNPARTVPILCPPLSRDTAQAPQNRAPLPAPPPARRAPAAAFPATPRCHSCGLRALVDGRGLRETATSGTLAGIMGMRFYHSGKFMPAGLIAGASLLMVAKVGVSMFNRPH
ncbi:transmembrane protein 14C isoform X2 [Pongo abelii]|uniref:transmembrane protein 14C isoform X2 n=1 Tax=Pongo abelii TaxID=9601 RepID=UPI0030071030